MKPGSKKGGQSVVRQSGGMRSMMGGSGLYSEREAGQALGGAMQQKSAAQQQSNTSTSSKPQQQAAKSLQQPVQPREISTIPDELIKRPLKDIAKEIGGFFSLNKLLGINQEDSPEDQAKKKQLHQRYQKLTQAEQQVAKQKYQEKLQRKQAEEREKQEKKKREEAKPSLPPPSGKKNMRGMAGMAGSRKKQAAQRMEHDRQRIGKVGSAN